MRATKRLTRPFTPALIAAAAGLTAPAVPALAQVRTLILDRPSAGARAVWAVEDVDGGGIQEPGELVLYWDSANNAGTAPMVTPLSMAARAADGRVAVGDSSAGIRGVFILHDFNRDNSALGFGESWIGADLNNLSGVTLNAPLGLAWGGDGHLYAANAGITGTQDAVYRLRDLGGDGKYQDAGEITEFVGVPYFGPGNNAAVGPAGLAIDTRVSPFVGYLKDSNSASAGVYRFSDADGSGRADDPGETTVFVSSANLSGVTIGGGGLTLSLDPARAGAVYFSQTVGGQRQLLRAHDADGDGDAQEAGELRIVWSTAEALSLIDVLGMGATAAAPGGRVMITDTGTRRIILLADGDGDGLFDDATERTTFYQAATPGSTRQLAEVPRYCQANCDGSTAAPVLNVADFGCFLTRYAAGDPYANCDGSSTAPVLNVQDFGCFLTVYAAGCS